MHYTFEWDPAKATRNRRKHGISFEEATGLFLDPLAVSIPDPVHNGTEERWVTIGRDGRGRLLVLIHTFPAPSVEEWNIRIISARRATSTSSR